MKQKRRGKSQRARGRLLVLNCHEAWVYQLSTLDFALDIVVGLPGRLVSGWDEKMRPVPANGRLITLEQALASASAYDCMIAHNITDLLDLKQREGPRLLVLHSTLDGQLAEQAAAVSHAEMRHVLHTYVELVRAQVVAVSPLKARSWGFDTGDVVRAGVDVASYPLATRELACGLRISNQITRRSQILLWDLHRAAFDGLPLRLIGHNPDLPGVHAAQDWSDLKQQLQRHRFYVHTARPELEDGYNMAMLEAMAAGLPVLGNVNPSSPITHGVDGFVSDDPAELRSFAERLLADPELARRMGEAARAKVSESFSAARFRQAFTEAIARAKVRYGAR